MSDRAFPEDTRYVERPEPGNDWRHRLERFLLALPVRFYPPLLQRQLSRRLVEAPAESPGLESLRMVLRREGLSRAGVSQYVAFARGRGLGEEDLLGALALARGVAVQCSDPRARVGMIAACAGLLALSGRQVHLLTADDDATAELHGALSAWLECPGVRIACLRHGMPFRARRAGYRANVVVVSAREALRDYLEDRLSLRIERGEVGRKLARLADRNPLSGARTRGLPCGILVDGNRVLVDQACTPMSLVDSTDPAMEKAWAQVALHLAEGLSEHHHFQRGAGGAVSLTDAGEFELALRAHTLPGPWRNSARRRAGVCQALQALALEPGTDYRVENGRVELAPQYDRREGLRQLLETRAGVPVTGRTRIRGKLTFQRFFRRYETLSAVCADTRHIRGELWSVYGMPCFELTRAADEPTVDPVELAPHERRLVEGAARLHRGLGDGLERALAAWSRHRERRQAARLRRSMLQLDNQVGTVTAFMGRSE
jgi:preprotein translocase subunit SecA